MSRKLYLYGVVKSDENQVFGAVELNVDTKSEPILLVCKNGLGALYAFKEILDEKIFPATRKNLLNHQRVVEIFTEKFTVLPFAFGTIVSEEEEVFQLLEENRTQYLESLEKIEGKIELGLKGSWISLDEIFEEIVKNNVQIREKREEILESNPQDQNAQITLGQMVENAMLAIKREELDRMLSKLTPACLEHKVQKNLSENMFANVVFLAAKSREAEFDALVNELSDDMGSNVKLKYVGPDAPVNFL